MMRVQRSMQVVILAGGLGRRLRPLTETIPKPMVPVYGQPYLHYQLEYLRKQGLKNILILTGYLGHRIQEFFKDGSEQGLRILYSMEEQPLGTGGALRHAHALLENQFLLINGDSFLPFDYSDFIRRFLELNKWGQICVLPRDRNDTGVIPNVAIENNSGLINSYSKSSQTSSDFGHVDAGVGVFQKTILSLFPREKKVFSLEEDIYPLLIQCKQLFGYSISQRFYDIGTSQRLKEFEEYIQHDYLKNAF